MLNHFIVVKTEMLPSEVDTLQFEENWCRRVHPGAIWITIIEYPCETKKYNSNYVKSEAHNLCVKYSCGETIRSTGESCNCHKQRKIIWGSLDDSTREAGHGKLKIQNIRTPVLECFKLGDAHTDHVNQTLIHRSQSFHLKKEPDC